MAFTLNTVVPWGRSFGEYERMFAFAPTDLRDRILGCADGPASFNAEATRRGMQVVSSDPLYQCRGRDIRARIDATYSEVLRQTHRNQHEFIWKDFKSPEDLGRARLDTMEVFLDDYALGQEQGRYVADELPLLSFSDQSFDLCLCSHFLFLYTDQLTEEFHRDSVVEMSRVAREVRIFPVSSLDGIQSRYVGPVTDSLQKLGFTVTLERVPYEFVRGSNQMMCIRKRH